MKILVITIGVLIVIAAVCGFDFEIARNYKENYANCCKSFGLSTNQFHTEAFKCAMFMDERIFDEDGIIRKDGFLSLLKDVIRKENKLKRAQEIFEKCYDEGKLPIITYKKEEDYNCTLNLPVIVTFNEN
ncbi:uncharacterized protein LOC105182109 [Harpegnathos saltator]|uniref:uncharacterized protein LOC105182109 n=1 Tax=Harpegnathos saltator TaxID=610380 RepID=UPI000591793D|nr:uncharacterized protein LOC105182109 [Harpegnathos saltator]